MNRSGQVILAIESAICGGSISLLKDGHELAHWIGSTNLSKAEDLLVNIDTLLVSNNISAKDINLIAVSAGPGSFTGIRIGLATAYGLKSGLGVKISSESALKAMVHTQPETHNIVAAVPVGRNAVCLQEFLKSGREVTTQSKPTTLNEDEFLAFVQTEGYDFLIVHASLYEKVAGLAAVASFGSNIAYAIGQICLENPGVVIEPLLISKSF